MVKIATRIANQVCIICLVAVTCLAQSRVSSSLTQLKAHSLAPIVTALSQQEANEYKIIGVIMFYDAITHAASVEVRFSNPLINADAEQEFLKKIKVTALPSNIELKPSRLENIGSRKTIIFSVSGASSLSAIDTRIRVCFAGVKFEGQVNEKTLCGQGELLSNENRGRVAELKKQALEALKTAKTSDEKNIFASGFAAKGEGKSSAGGTEIHLNSPDFHIPGLNASLHLRKNTAENADPKNFEVALTYRHTYAWDRDRLKQINELLAQARDPKSAAASFFEIYNIMEELRKGGLGAFFFDVGTKFEGEAANFGVTNFVGESMAQLQSPTKRLFGSTNGYWKFRLIPAGIELGKNLGKTSEAEMMAAGNMESAEEMKKVDYVARYKAGGALSFFYDNPYTVLPFKRIEGSIQVVSRYLFRPEVMFDEKTMKNVMTTKGNKPWYEAGLKFYFAKLSQGRFGFKISAYRGSLPPVFAETKSFQFGFVIESSDDGQKIR